jgi:hypothetical protein
VTGRMDTFNILFVSGAFIRGRSNYVMVLRAREYN